jgi:Domain of Unknown Function (DUF1080)
MKHLFNAWECRRLAGVVVALPFCLAAVLTQAAQENASNAAFAGRWDLTVKESSGHLLPSWLELTQTGSRWAARFTGRWGNARPLAKLEINGDAIRFVSPKEEEGSKNDLVFEGRLVDGNLAGSAKGPNGMAWTWAGTRAPLLPAPGAADIKWGTPVKLFNGSDFTGWTFDNPAKSTSWKVEHGCLVNQSAGSNIATKDTFKDFKLHIEVNCPSNANSGIYLRGRYEIQVEDDSIQEPPSHHMGAVYGFLAPVPEQPRRPGVWQTFDIALLGRYVTVVQNGQTIINKQEIPGITGGAIDSHEEMAGPIYLQGDHGGIAYRNIVLTATSP